MIQKQNGKLYMDTIHGLVLANMVEKEIRAKKFMEEFLKKV